ncbi:glucosamine-6-phosphate deaminase [Brumimicrobium glaciale]|uniref:Glucosamine-6-phosphate deaminase n=1 Tax=Brumimicrobium glaciale TaxID=200475 RepID=A0A4Q4KPY5_9FLAO|nr:glucosamine-6-phosphate deaminase [Brumimicrobium glaciale]RYM34937.1 glucosamine-6-phosphate deaminase [Brumimicrobium glaciale]
MSNNYSKHTLLKSPTLFSNAVQASLYTAKQIAELILEKQKQGLPAVLGLATGNTPKKVYKELIRLHQYEGLSFHNVVSFNLDEYYPIGSENDQSYTYFMNQNLFSYIDIQPKNIHVPHTDSSPDQITQYCLDYESKIAGFGGIDLQLLGIGRNGHIGFNEPGSSFDSTTRLVNLDSITREDAITDFGTLNKVPHQAISIGIHTIIQAKKILLLALGERKSEIINEAINGEISIQVPASILQTMPQVEYVLDNEAARLI